MKAELANSPHQLFRHAGCFPSAYRARSTPGLSSSKVRQTSAADDLAPAIRYADEGFPVTDLIAYYWGFGPRAFTKAFRAHYLRTYTSTERDARQRKAISSKIRHSRTRFSLIAQKGADAFYKGEIADQIDAFMKTNGGYLRKVDFEKHTSTWVDPVSTNYRGYDVFELPPNGQGIATLQMLNILEGFDLRAMGRNSPDAFTP